MDFRFERAYQDPLECCTPFNMHGTSGLVAMTSASHAEGRQFDPGLVYIFVSCAAGLCCATGRQRTLQPTLFVYVPRRCVPDRFSARPVTGRGRSCNEKQEASAEWRSG